MPARSLLVVAGEASGDLHGARLLAELAAQVPEVRAFGLGGDELRAAGLETVADARQIAVVGIAEALKVLPRARAIFRRVLEEVERRRPAAAVLVDFAEFNLRLAGELRRRGVPVVYYISPQVWAWRRRRVEKIARCVDRMLVLFPFEADFYRGHGVRVTHVGHPLVDEVPRLPQAWDAGPPAAFRLALLPGSRPSEVRALLPVLLQATRLLRQELPVEASLIQAPGLPAELLTAEIERAGVPVEVVPAERRFAAIAGAHLALCASGTATLEVGLLGTPQVVVYRLSAWSYLLGLLLVRLPYVSLVNLVLERRAAPELLQRQASAAGIAAEAARLLRDPAAIAAMRAAFAELRARLGEGGASRRAACAVAELLRQEAAA